TVVRRREHEQLRKKPSVIDNQIIVSVHRQTHDARKIWIGNGLRWLARGSQWMRYEKDLEAIRHEQVARRVKCRRRIYRKGRGKEDGGKGSGGFGPRRMEEKSPASLFNPAAEREIAISIFSQLREETGAQRHVGGG